MMADTLAARCGIARASDASGVAITGIAFDSRQVRAGDLFVALAGSHQDGMTFVHEAIARGAVAVASARPRPDGLGIPWLAVDDPRRFMSLASREIHRSGPIPSLVGITGTKGKSTTAYALAHILDGDGRPSGLLGTVTYRLGTREIEAQRTTPEAPDIEQYLQEMTRAGLSTCVMEVSSHAIAQQRVASLPFAVAIFTNLGRDHLDFHPDLDHYFATKRRLFEGLHADACAVVNADDVRAGAVIESARGARVIRYGNAEEADVRLRDVDESVDGVRFAVAASGRRYEVKSPLLGAFNAHNLTAAWCAAWHLGIDPTRAAALLGTFPGVPGRMEPVNAGQPFLCLVDYAHTPEALELSLQACRRLASLRGGQVIVVMGCGGDRDRGKRPLMGMAAAAAADHCIVTSDNPRSEDPLTIILDVEVGIQRLEPPRPYNVLPDRREAIRAAVMRARPGDVVLLAGKGHERTQTSRQGAVPFDDRGVARDEITRLMSVKGGPP